jgi:uroporphyrinogen-III decarboxylase
LEKEKRSMSDQTVKPFVPSPEYLAREKRFNAAVALTRPDRVPVASLAGLFTTRYSGLSNADALCDYEKMAAAWLASTKKLDWDMAPPPFITFPSPVMELLGLRTFKWPGKHFAENAPYQFVEQEYMLADEYDEFLANPSDFVVRKMMPRMADTLKPMGMLPPLHWFSSGYTLIVLMASMLGAPPITEMLHKLIAVGEEMNKYNAVLAKLGQDLAEAGYPLITFAFAEAPFDWISDMFRGLRGSLTDMYRQPDKLKAAIDLFTPMAIQSAVMAAQISGNKRIFIPLHRGAGGFMSNKQFEEFYWPGLKTLMLALIDQGLLPMPFLEGNYTPRLPYLAEMPRGKVLGHFDIVDLNKAKETIGDVMCFWGNVPAETLVTGTPQQVKDYVKKLIDIFGDNGGLILDGAVDGVPPDSKPENVEAIMEAALEYGVYS